MPSFNIIVWFFPILFVFHDFEEIILMKPWINRNKIDLSKRFPSLAGRFIPHFERITTSSFALGVFEEFIIACAVSYVSFTKGGYLLWMGLFIAFSLHLVMHCIQALAVRKYVPALGTSLLCLPVCLYILAQTVRYFSAAALILSSVLSLVLLALNLVLIHKGMEIFDQWLVRYENGGR